jgi:hypothetical protein
MPVVTRSGFASQEAFREIREQFEMRRAAAHRAALREKAARGGRDGQLFLTTDETHLTLNQIFITKGLAWSFGRIQSTSDSKMQ